MRCGALSVDSEELFRMGGIQAGSRVWFAGVSHG